MKYWRIKLTKKEQKKKGFNQKKKNKIWNLKEKKDYLLNDMITKIDAHKIECKLNVEMFVWDFDDFIKKIKINYKNQFKINEILNDELKKSKKFNQNKKNLKLALVPLVLSI
jgi:hypothetical protein